MWRFRSGRPNDETLFAGIGPTRGFSMPQIDDEDDSIANDDEPLDYDTPGAANPLDPGPDPGDIGSDSGEFIPCPHCGKYIHDDAEACPHCRMNILNSTRFGFKPTWFVATVFIVLVAFIFYWVFFGSPLNLFS